MTVSHFPSVTLNQAITDHSTFVLSNFLRLLTFGNKGQLQWCNGMLRKQNHYSCQTITMQSTELPIYNMVFWRLHWALNFGTKGSIPTWWLIELVSVI